MKKISLVFLTILIVFASCKKEPSKSDKKDILTFTLTDQVDSAKIDNVAHKVSITVASSADMQKLSPVITISENASVKPASGDITDFSNGTVNYTVTAEDNSTQIWKVTVDQVPPGFLVDLNQRQVNSIVIDKSNTQWVATDKGLYKKVDNGYELQNISISGKVLSLFYEKSLNTIWVGLEGGLSQVIISDVNISSSIVPISNLSNDTIRAAYVDATSKKWFGSNVGLSLNNGTTWKKENFIYNSLGNYVKMDIENASINSIASWDGDYFFATNSYGLYKATGYNESVDAFTGATSWASPYNGEGATDTVFTVFADSKGTVWLGGTNGVQSHTGHDSKLNNTVYPNPDNPDVLPNLHVHAVAEAPNGKIWVGTENGLTVFDGTTWTNVTSKLTNTFVTAIAFDADGSAWIGTKKGIVNIK